MAFRALDRGQHTPLQGSTFGRTGANGYGMNKNLTQGWDDYQEGRFREALNTAEAVLTLPNVGQPLVRVRAEVLRTVSAYRLDGNMDAGLRTLKKLQKQAPRAPIVRHHLGVLYTFNGQLDLAREQFVEALNLAPRSLGSFQRLAWITKYDRLDPLAEKMIALAARGDVSFDQSMPLHNALAKIYSDLGDYEKAFQHALTSKKLAKGSYSPKATEDYLDSLDKLKAAGTYDRLLPSGNQSEKPLFIVGMARSGTTLVETILGRHSDVRCCGELSDVQEIETALTKALSAREGKTLTKLQAATLATPDDLRPHAEDMLQRVYANGKGAYRLFTDKMPTDGLRLGLMARLFPKARIVFLRRDLRDCAISNLFTLLPSAYVHTQRLDWFGHYGKAFYRSVEMWRDMLDIEFLELNYEELVSDPEPHVRRLLDFAGLEFQPACLHPERGTNQIRTSSVWQARQSINARSVGRWKNYEPWLTPLLDALAED